ncbi:MAG: glycosyltransferase [Balneolaceae bacterium]|nr:glycosyltransferase [Balneolaceae bacterium]
MVFIIQQILPHYRFSVLKHLPEDDFKILYSHVLKEQSLSSVETDKANFFPIPIIRIGEKYFQFPFLLLFRYLPKYVVVTPELRNLTFWVLLLLKFFLRFKLVCWTHGINNKDYFTGEISLSGRFRMRMMKFSDQIITYSNDRAKKLEKLIKKPISVANNTLDTLALNEVYQNLSKLGIEQVYQKLGWSYDELHFIYVGRLIEEKEIVKSIELFQEVSINSDKIINFHIVGDGPFKQQLNTYIKNNQVNNVTLYGQILDSEILGSMLLASHLHLHLGYTGLAIVHSLCFACPIVTQLPNKEKGPYHSPEFEYLDESNSIQGSFRELEIKVKQIISDPVSVQSLKEKARNTFEEECSIEIFLSAFKDLID